MGLVAYKGKWERPDEVSRQAQDDPKRKALLKEYLQRRANTPETADGHWKLAMWCEQNGLKQQAIAHFHQVLKRDPSRDAAWKHLGFKKSAGGGSSRSWWPPPRPCRRSSSGRTSTGSRSSSAIAPPSRVRTATRRANGRASPGADHRPGRGADGVGDVRARGRGARKAWPCRCSARSTTRRRRGCWCSWRSSAARRPVRGEAAATLRQRDAREFAAMLIEMILEPIEYEVKKVRGPGQGGELLIKGQGSAPNVKRLYSPPAGPTITPQAGDRFYLDQNGLPVIARPEQVWNTGWFSPNSVRAMINQQPMPTAQKKGQFIEHGRSQRPRRPEPEDRPVDDQCL